MHGLSIFRLHCHYSNSIACKSKSNYCCCCVVMLQPFQLLQWRITYKRNFFEDILYSMVTLVGSQKESVEALIIKALGLDISFLFVKAFQFDFSLLTFLNLAYSFTHCEPLKTKSPFSLVYVKYTTIIPWSEVPWKNVLDKTWFWRAWSWNEISFFDR